MFEWNLVLHVLIADVFTIQKHSTNLDTKSTRLFILGGWIARTEHAGYKRSSRTTVMLHVYFLLVEIKLY
jgi:hypothetical protein